MESNHPSPFGLLKVRFFPRHEGRDGRYAAMVTPVSDEGIKVNGVYYSCRWDANLFPDGTWKSNNFTLDRKDRKETPFPFNARQKVEDVFLALCAANFTSDIRQELDKQQKETEIASLEGQIASLETELRDKRAELAKLRG